jgi:hypothetical protein
MNIVRVGTVSSVDVENRTARVIFADKQDAEGKPLVSGALKVLQNQPFIAFKKWVEDNSIPDKEPNTIKKIIITEETNGSFAGIYHSADRKLGIGEKYAKGELSANVQYEVAPGTMNTQDVYTTIEPDYIKESSWFKDGEKTLIKVYPWLPYIGQLVVCLYLANGESDGFVIGGM